MREGVQWYEAARRRAASRAKDGLPDLPGGKTDFARLWKRVCGTPPNLNGTPDLRRFWGGEAAGFSVLECGVFCSCY